MLNVKALTVALALGAVLAFLFYVAFGMMIPTEFRPGAAPGTWLPNFQGITFTGFVLGLLEVAFLGAFIGLMVGALNNYFHQRWAAMH